MNRTPVHSCSSSVRSHGCGRCCPPTSQHAQSRRHRVRQIERKGSCDHRLGHLAQQFWTLSLHINEKQNDHQMICIRTWSLIRNRSNNTRFKKKKLIIILQQEVLCGQHVSYIHVANIISQYLLIQITYMNFLSMQHYSRYNNSQSYFVLVLDQHLLLSQQFMCSFVSVFIYSQKEFNHNFPAHVYICQSCNSHLV